MAKSSIFEAYFLIATAGEVGYPEILKTNHIIINYFIPIDIKAYFFKTKTNKKTFLACLLIMTLLFGRSGPR
jgi:hypothetical protein